MVNIKINVSFDNFQGIDEKSSERVREILKKPRNRVQVKKASEVMGANTIEIGGKIPDRITDIDFRLYGYEKEVMAETLFQILKEIENIGYEFTYEFYPICMHFDDGGIDEKVFNEIITKKRTLGFGKIVKDGMKMTDLNTKKQVRFIFTLLCDKDNYINLLFEIIEDLKEMRYNFDVWGY